MKIQIGKEKLRANIPWRVTNNTTTNLGFVQPFMMLHTIANGDYKIKMQSQVRLSPLVAPTFAHMYLKTYARAIQITDIWQPFSNLYSGKPYKYSDSSELRYVTTSPNATLLTMFFNLIGCYDNFSYCPYSRVIFDGNGRVKSSIKYNKATTSQKTVRDNFLHMFRAVMVGNEEHPSSLALNTNSLLNALFYGFNWHVDNIRDANEFFNYDREFPETMELEESFEAEGADFILCLRDRVGNYSYNNPVSGFISNNTYQSDHDIDNFMSANECVGVRLGEFGKKLRQIYRGLGIPIDDMLNPLAICRMVEDDQRTDLTLYAKPFNVLPIISYAKCIYDQFGIRKFVDYSSTHIYNLVNEINNVYCQSNSFEYVPDAGMSLIEDKDNVCLYSQQSAPTLFYSPGFLATVLYELMQTSWYTLDVDLFSSINKSVGIQNNSNGGTFESVVDSHDVEQVGMFNDHSVYNDNPYYPIAINMANKLLHWVNTENVIGASIAKWFKEKYGISLDTEQTKYTSLIGHNSTDINIGPIFSQSDTVNESDTSGQTLGAFAGHGEARENVNTLSNYHSKDFGFIFTFGCVCPEVGYFQNLEPIYEKSTRFDYFTPEWDSMGFVPVSHKIINAGFLDRVAGVLPRYFVDKFKFSVVNGDMNLASTRNNMEAYWFNREVSAQYSNKEGLLLSDDFRRIGKKETLGFYNKIFTETSPFVDHYLIDCLFDIKASLPCKPIAESWDTVDEQDGQGKTITSKS